ncbi:MAG: hypothetical protein HY784_07690 [Chloroflexi bacterium]|nr:hypothetical protein [Chloroflexota bacterium]
MRPPPHLHYNPRQPHLPASGPDEPRPNAPQLDRNHAPARERPRQPDNANLPPAIGRNNPPIPISRRREQAAIESERGKLAAISIAGVAHDEAQAAASSALAQRNAAVQALDEWWREFRGVARVALKDRPDLLEQLGL